MSIRTMTPAQLADRLDRLAAADRRNPGGGDSDLLSWAARGLRQADAEHAKQFRRAEAALRKLGQLQTRVAEQQAQITELKANVVALESVAGRPAPYASEQHVECDDRGNVRRVVIRPLPESRPVGFS